MRKYLKNLFKIVGVFILVLALFLAGINYYLNTHKAEIFKKFEDLYASRVNGTLLFDNLSITVFDNFPSVAFVATNVLITDTISQKNKVETLKIGEVHLVISTRNLFQKKIQFKSLILKNSVLNLVTDSIGNNNLLTLKEKKDSLNNKTLSTWFSKQKTKIIIENATVSIIDYQKNKRITSKIKEINIRISTNDSLIRGHVNFDVFMNEMGLNLKNGTFFNGAKVMGEFQPVFDLKTHEIKIPLFHLTINDQVFKTKIAINTTGTGTFNFELENKKTHFKPTLALVSQNIQEKLKIYTIKKPFYTHTTITGNFAYQSNPLVKINFKTNTNSVSIKNEIRLNNTAFNGHFINRIYDDNRSKTENKKNFRLYFKSLKGTYQSIPFSCNNSFLRNTPKIKNYVSLHLKANAKATTLNSLFNNDTFIFKEGNFKFKSNFKGKVTTVDSLLVATHSTLSFDKSVLFYKPLELEIPIDSINLVVNKKNAVLKTLSIPLTTSENSMIFSGDIFNATSLVFDTDERVKSNVTLYSKNIIWSDFIALFKTLKDSEKKKETTTVFNEMLKGLYRKVNPSLTILIDEFHYNKFYGTNLKTGFYFKGENKFHLEKTKFDYKNGTVFLDLDLDISKPVKTSFNLIFDTNKLDLAIFLDEFEYFGISSLKETEKIAGKITMNAALNGIIDNNVGLETKSLAGKTYFKIDSLQLKGYKPIEKIADKVFKKSRFENIRFAPIVDSIYIENNTIEIPRVEIQSTAFDLFVEGQVSYTNKTHLWVSIPLSNLKHKDVKDIPNKKQYINSGKKIFIEITEKKDSTLNYKLHLSNKKMYKEKGILDQYKKDRKKDRKAKKEIKKKQQKKALF